MMNDAGCYGVLKDVVAFAGGFITLIITGLAAWAAIGQWRESNVEKRRERLWQRAAKGRELVDDLLKSDDSDEEYYAWEAMKMLDYQGGTTSRKDGRIPFRTKKIDGRRFEVTRDTIETALAPSELNESDPKFLYVRECFDELYFKLGQLQDAIRNDLVDLEHVSCPADYYVGLMADQVKLHHAYLEKYGYQRTLEFLDNYPRWKHAMLEKKPIQTA